jgi:undecaprenyl-diphosphatase
MLNRRKFDMDTLAAKLILGTIPAVLAGLLFGGLISNQLRGLTSIATFLILIGALYLYAEWKGGKNTHETVGVKKSLAIGAAQAIALIPGISRSGTTIAIGMLLGLNREAAAKFSFMLGGIAILAANVYAVVSIRAGAIMPHPTFTLLGTATSFLASLICIHWFLKFLRNHTLRPFAAYVILLGTLILTFL